MKSKIDMDALLAPIPGEKPAGEDLRYTPIYDDLKEARRADDQLERGEWQREIKTSDWDKVISLSVEALSKKSKDLQIAVWLTEALIRKDGFSGLVAGLKLLQGLLQSYWENLYPLVEDGDLEFRAAPLQFMNDKLWPSLKEVPLTDPAVTPGFPLLKWQESREVGTESQTLSRSGGVDENKKKRRDQLIAEGKLTAEEFDQAVSGSSMAYYRSLAENLVLCREIFKQLDEFVDQKFGPQAPRMADFRQALEDCEQVVLKIYKEQKGGSEPAPKSASQEAGAGTRQPEEKGPGEEPPPPMRTEKPPVVGISLAETAEFPDSDTDPLEKVLWEEALKILKASGIRDALAKLQRASNCAPSVRGRNRYRLLMIKLCLEGNRPDLARPMVEELNHLIEELHLERWESPLWIAEVLDALYQCLTRGEPSDEDKNRGITLFQKLCTTDVTKAMIYQN